MQPPRVRHNFLDALDELARSYVLLTQPWLGRYEDPNLYMIEYESSLDSLKGQSDMCQVWRTSTALAPLPRLW
jgi:hypothetical protein